MLRDNGSLATAGVAPAEQPWGSIRRDGLPARLGPKYHPQRQFPHGKQLKPSPRKRPSAPRLHADMKTQKKAVPTSRRLPPLYSPRACRKMMDPAQDNQGTFLSAIPADLSRTKVSLHQPSRLQTYKQRRIADFFSQGPVKRPTRAAGQVAHGVPLLQSLLQVGPRFMTRGARVQRLHSRGKIRHKLEQNFCERADLS